MVVKILMFLSICCCSFADRIPISFRHHIALKTYEAFQLQSESQSTRAILTFNEAYDEASKAGISPQKMTALRNLLIWYRKFGQYLELFGASDFQQEIRDRYRGPSRKDSRRSRYKKEKQRRKDHEEIKNDIFLGFAEIIGGLLGVHFRVDFPPLLSMKALVHDGTNKLGSGVNRLQKKDNTIMNETRSLIQEIETVAANCDHEAW